MMEFCTGCTPEREAGVGGVRATQPGLEGVELRLLELLEAGHADVVRHQQPDGTVHPGRPGGEPPLARGVTGAEHVERADRERRGRHPWGTGEARSHASPSARERIESGVLRPERDAVAHVVRGPRGGAVGAPGGSCAGRLTCGQGGRPVAGWRSRPLAEHERDEQAPGDRRASPRPARVRAQARRRPSMAGRGGGDPGTLREPSCRPTWNLPAARCARHGRLIRTSIIPAGRVPRGRVE